MNLEPLIKTISCESALELLDQLSPHADTWRSTGGQRNWWFRGQEKDWPLLPSAFREEGFPEWGIGKAWSVRPKNLVDQLLAERNSVFNFVSSCIDLQISVPEDGQWIRTGFVNDLLSDAQLEGLHMDGVRFPLSLHRSLYALAQHYGVPTRLLDWTPMSQIAAYFACHRVARDYKLLADWERFEADRDGADGGEEFIPPPEPKPELNPEEPMVVWALRTPLVLQTQTDDLRVVQVSAPPEHNPNLRAQRGIFTLVENLTPPGQSNFQQAPLTDVVVRLAQSKTLNLEGPEHRAEGHPWLVKFTLAQAHARSLLRELASYGVTFGAVYPGYQGALESLRECSYWK